MRCDTNRAIWWDLYNKHIFCIKHMTSIFRTLQVNKWWLKNQTFLSFYEIIATNFGSKNTFLHIIIYNYMSSYGYIIMIIFIYCMIWFHFDCIMQLKKSYHIATNVCSRKSATTFGDLPDWSVATVLRTHPWVFNCLLIKTLPSGICGYSTRQFNPAHLEQMATFSQTIY